ncbi:hypothetical protein E2C01_049194 [Portunus trituberculatus]|uniref:Uncharacterized protein n=1 Tax=Portunus trituberculatus TaxID=210409 RepID=A0A5B7G8K2_PORTR|nr:hypothetical protein [Portunus trituberculatus]
MMCLAGSTRRLSVSRPHCLHPHHTTLLHHHTTPTHHPVASPHPFPTLSHAGSALRQVAAVLVAAWTL